MRTTTAPRGAQDGPGRVPRATPRRSPAAGRGAGGGPDRHGADHEWAAGPLSGAALLGRLRVTGRARPAADPAFAADLRDFLEDGLAGSAVPAASSGPGRLLVTRDRLTRALACPVHRSAEPSVEQVDARSGDQVGPRRTFSTPLACGALVGALFRQIVAVGDVGDPMDDALEALSLDDRQAPLVTWIRGMAEADRSELRAEVDRQARGLLERWPSLDPSWMPRTQEVLRAALVGGTVELRTRVDLAVGRPSAGEASVALLEVVSGARRPEHRDDRRFAALVAALRGPVPPFAVATYYSRTGELEVDPVDHEYLVSGARRCLSAARVLLGTDQAPPDDADCAACRTLLRRPPVVVPVDAADRDGGSTTAGAVVGDGPVARVRPAGPGGPITFPREVAA